MHAATIVPQSYLDLIKDQYYHLALAHLVGKDGFELYTDFYKRMGDNPDKFLIMDNGLIEGDPRPIEELINKALYLNADEIVLPDIFQHHDETLVAAHDALLHVEDIEPALGTMVVAQGRDLDDWVACAKEILTWPITTIGIPKVLVQSDGPHARLLALERIQEHLGDKQVHLLGCWSSPLELKTIENYVRAGKIKPVRGVDSAIAYVYSRIGLRMSEDERPIGKIDFNAVDANWDALLYNIDMWQKETETLPQLGKSDKISKMW
jgi:hypothetical protein